MDDGIERSWSGETELALAEINSCPGYILQTLLLLQTRKQRHVLYFYVISRTTWWLLPWILGKDSMTLLISKFEPWWKVYNIQVGNKADKPIHGLCTISFYFPGIHVPASILLPEGAFWCHAKCPFRAWRSNSWKCACQPLPVWMISMQ